MEDFSPIARLNRIITDAKGCNRTFPTKRVWGKVLDFDYSDRVEIYEHSVEFYSLVQYVENTLGVLVQDQVTRDLYEKEFEKLKALAFTFLTNEKWNSYHAKIDEGVLLSLNMGKALYNSLVDKSEKRAGDEYLLKLREAAEELFGNILHSDLPRDLRLKLCGDVIRIKKALSRYELHGLDGIEEAVSTLGGRVGLHTTELDKSKFSDFHAKLNDMLHAYIKVAEAANVTTSLIENMGKFARSIGLNIGD
ncbi:hypothetical protein [Halomonas sp. hl-4]|uniref:hypothetical protein n=1 Tax=Halomonas sp. hl-4 TaxID=1761789 RepID=UPI000BB6DC38|nr:hypothetical protein [Halomonas sp. hl-4]SNY99197.1 hypothetical protein SAMN04488142_3836 [Halomonas sp. hl-4]